MRIIEKEKKLKKREMGTNRMHTTGRNGRKGKTSRTRQMKEY